VPVTHGGITIANFTGEPRQGSVTFPATGILVLYNGPFSGSSTPVTGDDDSAIDVIRAAKAADHPLLYLQLSPWSKETVIPDGTADIGTATDGLVLDIYNSPPKVAIDGGGRTIELDDGTPSSLITVKTGVTLTLRNITLIGFKIDPIVKVESGGQVIYETGVSIIEKTEIPFSGFTTDPDDSAIDKIRAAKKNDDASVSLTLSPGTEGVNLNNTSDLGTGLVLDSGNSPAVVTIDGQGREVRLDAGSANGSVITVGAGVTLTLKDIIFVGKDNNFPPLVSVNGGTLILDNGTLITGNKVGIYTNGAGIGMSTGTLVMNDGARISNNQCDWDGGGVFMWDGVFTMNGGEISGNTSESNGGGVRVAGGTFTMTGGIIYGNEDTYGAKKNTTSPNNGAALYKEGGTVQWNQNKDGSTLVNLGTTESTLDLSR
ncbi:MAG: hypothetical protein LBL43_05755, partial [Treponema sp.]|nr:hypothetical protein [Treponema sp.]